MTREPAHAEATRVLFCGDREIAASIVGLIRNEGGSLVGLGLNPAPLAAHAEGLRDAAAVDPGMVFYGNSFASSAAVAKFQASRPHLGVCCGFASVLPAELLAIPQWGWVNVHRSYLPYNRGLDPLQWAVIDGTPAGVTLHVMTEQVDAGPIVGQQEVPVLPTDSYHTLSGRADNVAFELFHAWWPVLRSGAFHGTPQPEELATYHSATDSHRLRRLNLDAPTTVRQVLNVLRMYTGDGMSGVYFEYGPVRYAAHLHIQQVGGAPDDHSTTEKDD